MSARLSILISMCFVAACSSSPGAQSSRSGVGSASDAVPRSQPSHDAGDALPEAAPGTAIVHGTMVDFESLSPVQGLTVTSDGVSATTDKSGQWSLEVPLGSTLHATVTSSTYSRLLFPDLVVTDPDVDLSTSVIPDSNTYSLEEQILSGFDS